MQGRRRIVLIAPEGPAIDHLALHLQARGHQVIPFTRFTTVLGLLYADPPDIVLADLTHEGPEIIRFVRDLRADHYFSTIPVIGLTGQPHDAFDWRDVPIDDFISQPFRHPELLSRIDLAMERIQRIFDNNPLTKLPGNTSIQRAIEESIGKEQAVCYIDINNFKPYNDTYGFTRGDEVIRMVARIMTNVVRESPGGGFVGHVGGDDFVFIVPLADSEAVCRRMIDNFNDIASELFGDKEKSLGYYVAKNRKGEEQNIPLLGIAIAVVPVNVAKITHCGKVAELAAELKKFAKKSTESCFVVDRRKT